MEDVLFVDDCNLMRGFDYLTCVEKGIGLLIASALPSPRAVRQALGRVCRNGQNGSRHLLSSLWKDAGVDKMQHNR